MRRLVLTLLLLYPSLAPAQALRGPGDEIKALEQKLKKAPGDTKTQAALIAAYLQRLRETADGSYLDLASRLVSRMIEQDGGNFAAQRYQNEIDLQRHDFKTVAARARDMTKYEPSDAGTWGNLGDALMELGEYEEAGKAYTKMFGLRPSLASYNRLGYFTFVTGNAPGGIALLRQAIEAGGSPENTAWCWAELGDMLFKTSALEDAGQAYRKALDLFPSMHRAYAGLGRVHRAQGQDELAIRAYVHAQSIVPMVEYAGALEDLYEKQGSTRKAGEQRQMIDAIDKLGRAGKEQTNRTLAIILADHNRRLDRALELMEAELPDRGDVYTWDAMSWVLFKLGRFEEARAASIRAMHMSTPEPAFRDHAAQIAIACERKSHSN